jgi:hypothetical protein
MNVDLQEFLQDGSINEFTVDGMGRNNKLKKTRVDLTLYRG